MTRAGFARDKTVSKTSQAVELERQPWIDKSLCLCDRSVGDESGSNAFVIDKSISTETDPPAPIHRGSAIPPLLSVQFFIQPCPRTPRSLTPLPSISSSYGRVLRCLWPSPEEGVAFGVSFWNRGYCHISSIQYDANDGRTLCSWRVRKRLPITMVSYLHALHGT